MSWTLDTDFIEPTELTGLIRAALADLQVNRFTLSRWLPNVEVDDIAYEFTKGGGGLAETASFRSWDAESKIGRREGIGKVMGELPPISEKIPLISFEYHLSEREKETTRKCIERLSLLGGSDLELNIAPAETMDLFLQEWISEEAFWKIFPAELEDRPEFHYGDIWARCL